MQTNDVLYWTSSRSRKNTIFAAICFSYFCYGTLIGTLSQQFSSLLQQMNTTEQHLGYANSIRSLHYGLFSLLATFTIKRLSRHVHFIVSQVLLCITLVLLPLLTHVAQYWAVSALAGVGMALSDCSSNMWIFEVFPENVNFYLQFLYFFFALGQTVGPIFVLLASQYQDQTVFGMTTSVVIPFYLNAFMYFAAFIFVSTLYIIQPYVDPKRTVDAYDQQEIRLAHDKLGEQMNASGQPVDLNPSLPRRYYVCFVLLANAVISLNSTNELSTLNLLPYFLSKSGIASDEQQRSLMGVATGSAYAVGHLAMMFGALRCSTTSLVYGPLVLVLISNTLLCLPNVVVVLHWIALIGLAVAFSTTFPALLSFIESRISITNAINCAFLATFSFLSAFHSLFIGDLMRVSFIFQIVNWILSLSVLILFVWLHLLDRWKARLMKHLNVNGRFSM